MHRRGQFWAVADHLGRHWTALHRRHFGMILLSIRDADEFIAMLGDLEACELIADNRYGTRPMPKAQITKPKREVEIVKG